jgi:hypothetical protein
VLSIDEKSQIQALERTQPGLAMREGRSATATHDYERHGTTTLFAALNVLDGRTVVGRCMQRHRYQEFVRFLNAVEAAVPAGKLVHAILDNYGTHKHLCGRLTMINQAKQSQVCRVERKQYAPYSMHTRCRISGPPSPRHVSQAMAHRTTSHRAPRQSSIVSVR